MLGLNLEEEKNRLRMIIDQLLLPSKGPARMNAPQFREQYLRYRKSGDGEMSFSQEDLRRVESFAGLIEKKLLKSRKEFDEVFLNRIKSYDGLFKFEEVKQVIQFNLQLEESLD